MIFRFSLYGFLKNQRYFEPFLVLVLLERGLSFTDIGWLHALRALTVNVLEIPSGAIADSWGRRRALTGSLLAYVSAFALLGTTRDVPATVIAFLLLAAGDAFRSGTHKGLIFAWLRREERVAERTKVYGLTRSWSKIGSVVSVLGGAALVLVSGRFEPTFLASIPPYLACLVNVRTYPDSIDVAARDVVTVRELGARMWQAIRDAVARPRLARVLRESIAFDGTFDVVSQYLQPVILALVVGGATGFGRDLGAVEAGRVALVSAPVYLVLALLAGAASRFAHHWVRRAGGPAGASASIWGWAALVYATLLVTDVLGLVAGSILTFLALHVLHNLWRPVLVTRLDELSDDRQISTTLSIDSQGRRIVTMILAPILGMIVDALRTAGHAHVFWPLGALGFLVAASFSALSLMKRPRMRGNATD